MLVLLEMTKLPDGKCYKDVFEVHFHDVEIREELEIDIAKMVRAEVLSAYDKLRVPCIVEHAGLVFEEHIDSGYPGGLTKPIWNSLLDKFITETHSAGRKATARAVVAYCDGKSVYTFDGETTGSIATAPSGSRDFYWDTIFVPDGSGSTYASIVAAEGLVSKMKVSQSAKAFQKYFEYLSASGLPDFWT